MKFDPEDVSPALRDAFNHVKYLGIDPGKSNGVCGFDYKYSMLFMYTVKEKDMNNFLDLFKALDAIICENFLLYPNKAMKQVYSDMPTSRVIGRIEEFCDIHKIKLVKQPATIKSTGYRWINRNPPAKGNPRIHEMDALVHFMYWAIKSGRIDASTLV